MDFQFPAQLFPSYFKCGPPDSALKHCAGLWGSYERLSPQVGPGPPSSWTFTPKQEARGESWRPVEPVSVPLLAPKSAFLRPSTPPDPLDFTEHLQNFYLDHSHDAFECMSNILGENFNFSMGRRKRHRDSSINMWKVRKNLDLLKFKMCHQTYYSRALNKYSELLWDVVPTVPPHLLGPLLYEELAQQRDQLLFDEGATGGALALIDFSQSSGSCRHGCLLYPGNKGQDLLCFHKVGLHNPRDGASCVDTSSSDPISFQLKGPIRQLSCTSLFNEWCVGVRLDHLCGVWRLSEQKEPHLLQVINTSEVATCISLSPHILGEVLVASESGAAHLWTVGRSMQEIRTEDNNLYFNAKSSWRWCEFSAHPRVMLYADRTGVELTDIRVSPASSHTLFRISSSSDCRSGERLIMSRYLGDTHSFHHLITTQFSAYIMDERFPCVPMLKLDHMMQSPPVFCHIVAGSAKGEARNTKIFLGSHASQEITLLQYSGGRAQACSGGGPPQALLTARDSLKHLPVQIPHRHKTAINRLSAPATGLTCIPSRPGEGGGPGEESIHVLQLTEAGDIFCQVLELSQQDTSQPRLIEAQPATPPPPRQVVAGTSSEDGIFEATQAPAVQRFVSETPERERQEAAMCSDFSSDDSQTEDRLVSLKRLRLPVVVNQDPDWDQVQGSNTAMKQGAQSEVGATEGSGSEKEMATAPGSLSEARHSPAPAPAQLSQATLLTWKRWLQKVTHKRKHPPHSVQHFTIRTEGLLSRAADDERDSVTAKNTHCLRQDLRRSMTTASLLVNSNLSASVQAAAVLPVPNEVDTEAFRDPLSQRLSLSWQGQEAWLSWWEEELGTNREAKVQALRRKRRREKKARRAAGKVLELSDSFSSSASCLSEPDDFSDGTGRSTASSQAVWSDTEDTVLSKMSCALTGETAVDATPSTIQADTPICSPQKLQGDPHTPRASSPPPRTTAASSRRSTQPDDLSWKPQEDSPHNHRPWLQEQDASSHPPPPARLATSSQTSVSSRSQGRPRSSQLSQPRKKSRMGF